MKNLRKMLIAACCLFNINALAKDQLIAINQFVRHPALDQCVEGIKEILADENIMVKNANGNISTSIQISNNLLSQKPEILIGVATPAAQSNLKARKNHSIPLAFVAVSDPKAIGLTNAKNIIGVADAPPVKELINLIKQKLPETKKIGILFNLGEINSVNAISMAREEASRLNLEIIELPVTSTNEISSALANLLSKVDILFLPPDNIIVSAIDLIVKKASDLKIPIVSNDPALLEKGLLFTFGSDYKQAGRKLGEMILEKLSNKNMDNQIIALNKPNLQINNKVAKAFSLKLNQEAK